MNETGATRFHRCVDGRRITEHAVCDAGKGKIGRPSLNQVTQLEISILNVTKDLYLPKRLQEGFQMLRMRGKDSL